MSAIFFGPPGTSKTELAKVISGYLNWPLLSVDPSYVVQEGLDKVQAMANKLFSMLLAAEQIVVLLDEFDELGRDRAGNENLLSRFITTAMLPRLAAINKERKIVFLLATNYLSGFDAAFRRSGRFDMQLQVMPPSLNAKLNPRSKACADWKSTFATAVDKLSVEAEKDQFRKRLTDLTFLETKKLARELKGLHEADEINATMDAAWRRCTLEKPNDTGIRGKEEGAATPNRLATQESVAADSAQQLEKTTQPTWRLTCEAEASEISLPPIPPRT